MAGYSRFFLLLFPLTVVFCSFRLPSFLFSSPEKKGTETFSSSFTPSPFYSLGFCQPFNGMLRRLQQRAVPYFLSVSRAFLFSPAFPISDPFLPLYPLVSLAFFRRKPPSETALTRIVIWIFFFFFFSLPFGLRRCFNTPGWKVPPPPRSMD